MGLINKDIRQQILLEREQIRISKLQLTSDILTEYFKNFVFTTKESVERIISNVSDITSNCNVISYNEELNAETYALWHFLDRYHRFQIIFDELLRQKVINFSSTERKYPYDILDIGTGPGISMYAMSDFLNHINSIGKAQNNKQLENLKYNIDYLERSDAFRNWLHRFTERYNFGNGRFFNLQVPFHHGNFIDFRELDFDLHYTKWIHNYPEVQFYVGPFVRKFRFDLVLSSNFFTDLDFFKENLDSFKKVVQNIRNRGLLIIIGGKGGHYKEINDSIKSFCENYKDDSGKFDAKLEQIELESEIMSYPQTGEAGKVINNFRSKFFDVVDEFGLNGKLDKNLLIHKKNCLKGGLKKDVKWQVTVFRKQSKFIKKNGKARL